MRNITLHFIRLLAICLVLAGCGSTTDTTDGTLDTTNATVGTTDDTFTVYLPRLGTTLDPDPDCNPYADTECIEIPNGRPIYALLVSGFHQNSNLDMFHYYNFAKCLQEKGAYVHYAWWNNLLAPYMERPLHDDTSVPSIAHLRDKDALGFIPIEHFGKKAIPGEDFQFQADAEALLKAIRKENPDAAIIIVGHSYGGSAVARLGANTDIDIDLLAPIDPVGNRTCLPWNQGSPTPTPGLPIPNCNLLDQATRYRATHNDWYWFPTRRAFGSNIKYLYHRWQQEFLPPLDYTCPQGGNILPCLSLQPNSEYLFIIQDGTTSVQSRVPTSIWSGFAINILNTGGGLDGHGEIVGFRGLKINIEDIGEDDFGESYPLALKAPEYWPSLDIERSFANEADRANVRNLRISLLKEWETDPDYLDDNHWAPTNPEYCMVSGDLCEILRTAVKLPPVADAGPDQIVECSSPNGTLVTLDGSGSTDPNDEPLIFTWVWPDGTMMGETAYVYFTVGTHTITLTVDDGTGKTDTDTVNVTVVDSTPPSLSVSLSPDVLWPPNHKLVSIAASIQVSDSCDESPNVELVSIISNEADNGTGDGNTSDDIQGASYGTDDQAFSLRAERAGSGPGRIYTVTYGATDASGNETDASAEVTVSHDSGK